MPRKPDTAAELSAKLLTTLQEQHACGKDAYPIALERLVLLAEPQAPPESVWKAVAKKPFKDGSILTSKIDSACLVALAQDIDLLAGDGRLLEAALTTLCTAANPLWPLAKVKRAVENTKLRTPFAEAVTRRIRDNTLPPAVGCRLEKNKPLLYLQRIPPPPPPPPPKKPEQIQAEQMLRTLQEQRQLGPGAYPLSLQRLVELASPGASAKLVQKALGHPALQGKIAVFDGKKLLAPVALAEDRGQLVASDVLLDFLLRSKRKPNEQAFPATSLVSKKSAWYQPVLDSVNQRIEAGTLPAAIGWMWIGKKKQLFFLEDVRQLALGGQECPPHIKIAVPQQTPADFARSFEEAFGQIDRQTGSHNFVSLVELRRRLAVGRGVFDSELRKLRLAGRFTLSPAEGRHGISPEEQDAGIVENGALLLYVSRKTP